MSQLEIPGFRDASIIQRTPDGRSKRRRLQVPSKEMMQIHHEFLIDFEWVIRDMPYAMGSVPRRGLMRNVLPHALNRYFYQIDIIDAFPSVDADYLIDSFQTRNATQHTSRRFTNFVLNHAFAPDQPGLPLGAPASPLLFNIYMQPTDETLGAYCEGRGIEYTRYLDDLTFSAEKPIGERKRRAIREILEDTPGMRVNHQKSHVHSLENGPVTITGVSIYPDGRIQPAPHILEAARIAFSQVIELIEAGEPVEEQEIARAHGYYGAINQLSQGHPNVIHRLNALYYRAVNLHYEGVDSSEYRPRDHGLDLVVGLPF